MKAIHTFTVPISLCFLENQSSFWNINSYDLHVISSEHCGLLKEFGKKNHLDTFAIPFTRNKDILNSLSNVRMLYAYFRKHRPTLVHGNTPKAAFLSMMAATFARVPVRIYEMHGLPLETARWPWKLFYWGIEKNDVCVGYPRHRGQSFPAAKCHPKTVGFCAENFGYAPRQLQRHRYQTKI